ncbi:MAG: hypothetical protein MZU91_05230 [Desulfosudis oleivorans]|nr:hypothetical protein [Desulfosudis oleivorans]
MAYWYNFALMFEALFILTTVDTGTRVARFLLQDLVGHVWKPVTRQGWIPGIIATSLRCRRRLGLPHLFRQHRGDLAHVRRVEPAPVGHRPRCRHDCYHQIGKAPVCLDDLYPHVLHVRDHIHRLMESSSGSSGTRLQGRHHSPHRSIIASTLFLLSSWSPSPLWP